MTANELRIGNYLQLEGISKPIRVSIIDTTQTSTKTKYKPIPLTEEWFLKFGFRRHWEDFYNDVIYIKKVTDDYTEFEWGVYPNELGSGIQIKNSIKLKYVHQLQNLYFALTGEELTLKTQ